MLARLALALLAAAVAAAAARADYVYSLDGVSPQRYPATVGDNLLYFINDRGVSAGYVSPAANGFAGPFLPITYTSPGGFNVLSNSLQSTTFAQSRTVSGISNGGTVAGSVLVNGVRAPYLFANGSLQPLTAPSGFTITSVNGVSPNGVAYGTVRDVAAARNLPFLTTTGAVTPLTPSAGGFLNYTATSPDLMNAAGLLLVAGTTPGRTTTRYLLDTNTGQVTPLAPPPAGATGFLSPELTENSLLVQLFDANSVTRFGLWNLDGTFRGYVDSPDGVAWSSLSINDRGEMVGFTGDGFNNPYALWAFDGRTWDAGRFIGSDGHFPFQIYDLNNNGQFVGGAFAGGGYFGFVATRTPEPASVAVFGGLLAAGAWAVRRWRK